MMMKAPSNSSSPLRSHELEKVGYEDGLFAGCTGRLPYFSGSS
jgi:hypothetical protein